MPAFNAYRIKRQANLLSRQSGPFAHIQWRKKQNSTFPLDVEQGHAVTAGDNEEGSSPLTHINSAPAGAFSSRDGYKERDSDSAGAAAAATTETASTAPPANDAQLRNRKPEIPRLDTGLARSSTAKQEEPEEEKPKKKGSKFLKHVEPKEPFTVANQLQRTFLNSWINVLLVAAPAGIALHFAHASPILIFTINFIAIIPLAALLGFATEEIALRTGDTLGGLLNATFGNAVELIVAIIALMDNQVTIVQTSLIGSILSNLLLVLGMCFFFGGLRRTEQHFNITVAQTAASLLALAVAGVIVPTVFDRSSSTPDLDVAMLSRGVSVILLVVYAAYLFFQLHTHHEVFSEESQKVPAKPFRRRGSSDSGNPARHGIAQGLAGAGRGLVGSAITPVDARQKEQLNNMLMQPAHDAAAEREAAAARGGGADQDDEEEPQLHFLVALALLAGSTIIIAFCAEFLVDSIDYVTSKGGISKEFLGLILLPIVGNAAEHATAVSVAIKDKLDLAIGVAVGSSMQVALFLIPLLVIIGWGKGIVAMGLSFDIFQVAVLFVSVLLVNYLIADGKSHWLEGMLLICLYAIIAVCSWWYPTSEAHNGGNSGGA
ncbi:calcium-proton exchanger [Gaeumannomyces tritici R3-111a-1]|uniref:Calcium-proton exchanger n=1 Tax=Gaeumannomyces tritici (strain R3-111a-1) TaxID=644352 RepID=J3NNU7_GAET3|nr:calcium-proton exchanger [Gaeumannomyces tritici R3-111a-1]EJT77850.1 calcium-proton exchanger [Gaeumannomyces tritici R3-111a-1]